MTDRLVTSLEQAGEGSLADLIDRLTLYEHREGYDGKDWEKIASEAAEAIRALHADKAMLTGQLQASRAMLAASTPVGCWEEPVAWQRRMRNTSSDASDWQSTWSEWKQCTEEQANYASKAGHVEYAPEVIAEVRPVYAAPPPPSVSIGSRPQETVPTEQTAPPVVGLTDAQMVQCFRDHYGFALNGPWPGVQVPHYALAGLFKMAADRIEALATPQPADGCSSNEGAEK